MMILTQQQQNVLFDQLEVEDLTSEGEFDGGTNCPPNEKNWSNLSYRNGYLSGLGRFYDRTFGVTHADQLIF